MPEPPASTFEPTPQTSRCWRAGARMSGPSASRSASGSGNRPRTHSEHRPRSVNDRVSQPTPTVLLPVLPPESDQMYGDGVLCDAQDGELEALGAFARVYPKALTCGVRV